MEKIKRSLPRSLDFNLSITTVEHLWTKQQNLGPNSCEAARPASTGNYLLHVTRRPPLDNPASKLLIGGTIGTLLPSLSNRLLLPGFSFAFVDKSGQVMFHSQASKNNRENLVNACNRNRQLLDLIELRQAGMVNVAYAGIASRAFVKPVKSLANCPWTLVVFYNLGESGVDYVKAMTIFALLLGAYVAMLLLFSWIIDFVALRLLGIRDIPEWLWPQRKKLWCYWHITGVLAVAFLITVLIVWIPATPTQLVVMGFTLPLFCFFAVALKLQSTNWRSEVLIALLALALGAVIFSISEECRQNLGGPLSLCLIGLVLLFSSLALPTSRISVNSTERGCLIVPE